jgi:hypothetical protein
MNHQKWRVKTGTFAALIFIVIAGDAAASTLTQNLSWTINRSGTTT